MRATLAVLLCAGSLLLATSTVAGEDALPQAWQESLLAQKRARVQQLIRQLDTSAPRRVGPATELQQAARGDGRDLVLAELNRALGLDNEQLREGVIDTLGLIGDPRSIPTITWQMRFDPHPIVRRQGLLQLPTFLVRDLRLREGVREALVAETYAVTDRIRGILRRGGMGDVPETFDPSFQALRDSVREGIAGQLDPVGSVIDGFRSPRDRYHAQRTLSIFFSKSMGENADEWREVWHTLESDPATLRIYPGLRGMEGVQISACRILADIGAEGTESVCAKLQRLIRLNRPDTRETALRTLVTLAELSQASLPAHRRRIAAIRTQSRYETELVWHQRRVESAERLQALAWDSGRAKVASSSETFRALAYRALAAGAPPEERERSAEAVQILHDIRIAGTDSAVALRAMAEALGRIGTEAAVQELAGLAARRSHTEQRTDWRTEYRVVSAALEALAGLAVTPDRPGAAAAFEELLALRGEETRLRGGPVRGGQKQGPSIGEIALYHLSVLTELRDPDATADVWRAAYARMVKQKSGVR